MASEATDLRPVAANSAAHGMLAVALAVVAAMLSAPVVEAQTVGQAVRVSPDGHTVAEFSAATSPQDPSVMAASAIDNDQPESTRCAVYASRDGGGSWSEAPAWTSTPALVPSYDPWVAIGADGTIHASCIAITNVGARVVYTRSTDRGASWTAARTVTPLPSRFHRQSADKSALTVAPDGTVYVCFTQVLTGPLAPKGLIVARSADGGLTWTPRDTGVRDAFCNGLIASQSTVTVAFIASSGSYGTVTSTDRGDGWAGPVSLGQFNGINLPSIVRDSTGRTVIGEVAESEGARLVVSIEGDDGALVEQRELPRPGSSTCTTGRLIHPALTAAPGQPPALQIACKVDATTTSPGRQEVWVYPSVDQPTTGPIQTAGLDLPAGRRPSDRFAQRFPDGGDYWSFTWRSGGLLSMWVDPRTGGGPGELWAAPLTP